MKININNKFYSLINLYLLIALEASNSILNSNNFWVIPYLTRKRDQFIARNMIIVLLSFKIYLL